MGETTNSGPGSTGYVLGMHGDPWAIELGRMRGYLNTFVISDISPEEVEERTGPREVMCVTGGLDDNRITIRKDVCGGLDSFIVGGASPGTRKIKQAIAVLPLHGPITQRSSAFSVFFGGTSTEKWGQAFDALIASPQIGAIVLDVDSPGGTVYGVPELADKVFKARGSKPIVAVANAEMFSAAYYVASAADEVVVTPSGQTGSIGVWSLHVDYSGMLEQEGMDATFISAGEKKVWGNPYEPLTKESQAMLQAEVDTYYNQFIAAIAKHRGVTPKQVRDGYGQGATATAKESVALGLADRVATLDDTIRRLGGKLAEREEIRVAAEKREAQVQGWEAEVEETDT